MADFDPAFDKMIRNEGGFKLTHIAGDRGGQTYAGIAKPGELPSNTGGLKHERLATD